MRRSQVRVLHGPQTKKNKMNAKYVIIDGKAIVFSSLITHSSIIPYGTNVLSAGFVSFGTDDEGNITVYTYGRSESLDVDSSETDSKIIKRQIIQPYYN
jgi:hypothetical protein